MGTHAEPTELDTIALDAIAAMERALQQAMIELTQDNWSFVPIDEVTVLRSRTQPPRN
ncbi:hypothetical protein GCM10011390_23490 [Aureimonas endophytica]|uniref:Uncharacterized protein n=1 Tax=Aureimonas endophytica TaxID=2027858 RepID=A0A917E546_9HYPH|nr:hypothetical protein [Aureimonas endophytica]GGE03826.1 hypothetical protein GCM10011390_23490 [Aureimonas endophytica]